MKGNILIVGVGILSFICLGAAQQVRADTPSECEVLIPCAIMLGYNFETQCTIKPKAGIYTYEITLIKPQFLKDDDFVTFVGACVGLVGVISSESSWKSDYLYMNANGKRWHVATAACREAIKRMYGEEAKAFGTYIINGLELVETPTQNKPPSTGGQLQDQSSGWLKAGGRLWTGVKLYYGSGPDKMYVGEVLGGNENYKCPVTGDKFRGVKVRMRSGSAEWKDGNAIVEGEWYVKADDPALSRMEWEEYEY